MVDGLFLKITLIAISLGFIYISIVFPVEKHRRIAIPLWFKILACVYVFSLKFTFIVFFYIFTPYWAILSIVMSVPFIFWALRVNNFIEINILPLKTEIIDIYFIRYLYLCLINERWDMIIDLVDNIFEIMPNIEKRGKIEILLIKSYAYIKLTKNEEAMDLLFSMLDIEKLDYRYKEAIKFQFDLIEKHSLVA